MRLARWILVWLALGSSTMAEERWVRQDHASGVASAQVSTEAGIFAVRCEAGSLQVVYILPPGKLDPAAKTADGQADLTLWLDGESHYRSARLPVHDRDGTTLLVFTGEVALDWAQAVARARRHVVVSLSPDTNASDLKFYNVLNLTAAGSTVAINDVIQRCEAK